MFQATTRTYRWVHVREGFLSTEFFDSLVKELDHKDHLNERKETRRHQSLGGFCPPDPTTVTAEQAERLQLISELKFALKHLTRKQREVVIFYAVHKMSFREIGDKLGIHKETVREIYHAGIRKLKKVL